MNINIDYKLVGQRIKILRSESHMTQADLSEYIDVSTSYVSLVESGKKHPSLKFFIKAADALHTTLDYLLTGTCPPSDKDKVNPVLLHIFSDCSESEKNMLIELFQNTKGVLKKYGHINPQ